MRKLFVTVLMAFLLPALACGQSITVPAEVHQDSPGLVIIRATAIDADAIRWYSHGTGLQTFPLDVVQPQLGTYLGFALTPGTYKVGVIVAKAVNGKALISIPQTITVIIGTPTPPPPPVPPVPPVPPTPPPEPAPISEPGLRVLVVYESADSLPRAQLAILTSAAIRDWLNKHCVKGADGKTAEWRIWDKDVDVAGESPLWQAAFKRSRKSAPWLLISNPGKGGYEGPLPASSDDMTKLLEKYQ